MEIHPLLVALIIFYAFMFVLALDYLRRRTMRWQKYAIWGLVALALPALGPFMVIAARPGVRRRGGNRRSAKRVK